MLRTGNAYSIGAFTPWSLKLTWRNYDSARVSQTLRQAGGRSLKLMPHCANHGLKNNTRLTRSFNPKKKKSVWWRYCQSENGCTSVLCLTGPASKASGRHFAGSGPISPSRELLLLLLVEMPSSRAVFDLNYCKSEWKITCGFVNFQKTRKCAVLDAYYSLNHGTAHSIFQS